MSARPILFSAPMIRALLDGSKTQTRRIIKPSPIIQNGKAFFYKKGFPVFVDSPVSAVESCLYGVPGDQLWVREEHYRFGHWEPVPDVKTKIGRMKWRFVQDSEDVLYQPPLHTRMGRHHKDPTTPAWHKRLARFMPRLASRITLRITAVRVKRLHDISETDAIAEGIARIPYTGENPGPNKYSINISDCSINATTAVGVFRMLWESINGDGSWDANPWVWVICFEREAPVRNAMIAANAET